MRKQCCAGFPLHSGLLGLMGLLLGLSGASAASGFVTSVTNYTRPVGPDYDIVPILSTGDRLPRTSNPSQQYQMVGIPDGLGAHRNADGTITVYMNHELRNTQSTEPIIGAPLNLSAAKPQPKRVK